MQSFMAPPQGLQSRSNPPDPEIDLLVFAELFPQQQVFVYMIWIFAF
jgi:hypothetical protein